MMRRLTVLTCLMLAASGSLAAPLWELKGTSNSIRLLGSVHFLRAGDAELPDAVRDAYRDAEILVMELDMDDLNPLQAQSVLLRLAVDPDGRDLPTIVGKATYGKARRAAARVDIELDNFRQFEPWYAALMVTQLRLAQLGFTGDQGIEARLTRWAGADGKQIRGLETLQTQLGFLDSLSPDAQQEFLEVTVDEAIEIQDNLDDIVDAWRRGDARQLEDDLLTSMASQKELYDKILVARNRSWTASIADLVNQPDDYLIVVGALHLVGDDSVLAMLKDAGYDSRQVLR